MSAPTISIDPFANPCGLWVLPPPRLSAWFPLVDWYLNWQMSKGIAYSGLHLPNEVLRLAEDYEVELPMIKTAQQPAPLLILSHGRLPTDKCVVLDYLEDNENWLNQAHQISLDLDVKNVHVFLPAKVAKEQAAKIWGASFANREARFSSDMEAKGSLQ